MYTIVTHDGSYHTDEVFAVATLQLHLGVEHVHVLRTRDTYAIENADWVLDVGRKYDPSKNYFDHHQAGGPVRDNGIPYSSFGLVWQEYGESVTGSKEIRYILDEKIVQPVDAGDNGVALYTLNEYNVVPFELYNVVKSYAPADPTNSQEIDKAFMQAVDFARHLLERMIAYEINQQKKMREAEEIYQNSTVENGVLVIDVPMSTGYFSSFPDVALVVRPGADGANDRWIAKSIPVDGALFEYRAEFPQEWAGLSDAELQTVSGIDDALFCHAKRFICIVRSKEGAVQAAQKASRTVRT